jgi:hypothetical protein
MLNVEDKQRAVPNWLGRALSSAYTIHIISSISPTAINGNDDGNFRVSRTYKISYIKLTSSRIFETICRYKQHTDENPFREVVFCFTLFFYRIARSRANVFCDAKIIKINELKEAGYKLQKLLQIKFKKKSKQTKTEQLTKYLTRKEQNMNINFLFVLKEFK